MQNQCILSADFLKANGMVVDIGHEQLSWASGQTPLLIEAAPPTNNKLSVLLEKYSEVFVNGQDEPLGRTSAVEHSIDTGDTQPIKQRPYRIPVHLHHVVHQQVEEMLARRDACYPLHELTKGGQKFCWTPSAEKAFNHLKTDYPPHAFFLCQSYKHIVHRCQ